MTARAILVLVAVSGCARSPDVVDDAQDTYACDASVPATFVDAGAGADATPESDAARGDASGGADACIPSACTPSNPCAVGAIDCASGACAPTAPRPNGTSCGANMVCNGFTCVACTQGAACTPANACHTGQIGCATGSPVCADTSAGVPDGTACGAQSVCVGGACTACGAASQPCCTGSTCGGAALACPRALASACRAGAARQCTCGLFLQGMELAQDDRFWSCDGRFFLALQGDNNLVLYQVGGPALWSSNTVGTGAATAIFQDDGNFVLYTAAGVAVWSTATAPGCGAKLAVQTDGNLVVYDAANAPLWSSGTCCH